GHVRVSAHRSRRGRRLHAPGGVLRGRRRTADAQGRLGKATRRAGRRTGPRMNLARLEVARVFHALGDPTRRAIVETLSERPQSVSHLATPLAITPTAVIQHLRVLEESGLVRTQ